MSNNKDNAQVSDEVDIHIHFKKTSVKTSIVFCIGLVIIFCLSASNYLRIACVVLGVLFLLGSFAGGSSGEEKEDKKNEGDTPVEQPAPIEQPVMKNIKRPKMPQQNIQPEQAANTTVDITTEEQDMTKDDWADFFASLDQDEG